MPGGVEEARRGLSGAEVGHVTLLQAFERGGLGEYALVPGDPDRIRIMARQWDQAEEYQLERGFRLALGVYKGSKLAALSSGIGGPSLEYVLTEAAVNGVNTFVRVGTTGALHEGIENGDLIINEASVRLDGLSRMYVRDEFPAVASYDVTQALVQACEEMGIPYHMGIGATTASFYAGQGRTSFGGYRLSGADEFLQDIAAARVLNFEKECAALFVLCRLFGLRAGAVSCVVAQRVTGEWGDRGGIERACLVGAEAIRSLTEWDQKRKCAGRRYFYPGILAKPG